MLTLTWPKIWPATDEEFATLAQANPDLQLEMTATGELLIMPPTGGETGAQNSELIGQLWSWNRQAQLGEVFDSSTGFVLPNGARRSPDLSWIKLDRWQSLAPEQRRKFIPLCPDFAVELMSQSDELAMLQAKMDEYLENGLRLGWLICPATETVYIYRPSQAAEMLKYPQTLSGETVLPGFGLNLGPIWSRFVSSY